MRNRAGALLAVAGLSAGVLGMSPTAAVAGPRDSVHTFLTGTLALSATNAWTVGWAGIGTSTANSQALHWNGTQWVSVATAQQGTVNGLEAISGTSGSDMWGVGWVGGDCLIEHFNGQKWANVSCPYQGLLAQLNGVSARTTSDAWAVGSVTPASDQLGFAEHWNGTRWTQVKTAAVSSSDVELTSVLDLGAGNVLAVGYYQTQSSGKWVKHQLAEHWNGRAWSRVTTPQFSTASDLMSVAGGSGHGVIAVGAVTSSGHQVPLIERWTGTQLVRITEPVSSGDLAAVTVLSSTSAYAVGETGGGKTLVEHFDGTHWTQVATPNPVDGGYFSSVSVTPSGSFAVAAGWHGLDPDERPLIEQGNGKTWRITRS